MSGVGGEQFALPEAVGALREVRRTEAGRSEADDEVTVLSAVDPVNALGVDDVPSGARLAARTGNRVAYRAGRPIAVLDGGRVIYCERLSPEDGLGGAEAPAADGATRSGRSGCRPRHHARAHHHPLTSYAKQHDYHWRYELQATRSPVSILTVQEPQIPNAELQTMTMTPNCSE